MIPYLYTGLYLYMRGKQTREFNKRVLKTSPSCFLLYCKLQEVDKQELNGIQFPFPTLQGSFQAAQDKLV